MRVRVGEGPFRSCFWLEQKHGVLQEQGTSRKQRAGAEHLERENAWVKPCALGFGADIKRVDSGSDT